MSQGVANRVKLESTFRQSAKRIACGRSLAVGKCAGQSQSCISAESRGWVQPAIESGDPWCALREADVGSLAIVAGNEEDAIAATEHKLVTQLIGRANARGKISMGGMVDPSVATG